MVKIIHSEDLENLDEILKNLKLLHYESPTMIAAPIAGCDNIHPNNEYA